jgi:hypothetical protein
MRFVFLFLITMLFVLPAYAQAPFCQIGRDSAPVIDGVFDEPQWQECAHVFPFSENMGTGMAAAQTDVRVFYDAKALYFAFTCEEPFVEKMVAIRTQRDIDVWQDDCVELSFQIPGDITLYHILINSNGLTSDSKFGNNGWDPALVIATFKNKEAQKWGVELSIPWNEFERAPLPEEAWLVNFTRQRKVEIERSAWSPTFGTFTNVSRYGQIRFSEKPVIQKRLDLNPFVPGINHARVQLQLPTDAPAQLSGDCSDGLEISNGDSNPVDLIFPIGLCPKDVVLSAENSDGLLWRTYFPYDPGFKPALANCEQVLGSLRDAPQNMPSQSPLRKVLQTKIDRTDQAARALTKAINKSLVNDVPIQLSEFKELNQSVAENTSILEKMQWTIWTKNNWHDLRRNEVPDSFSDVKELTLFSCVNEWEHTNVIVSNFKNRPLRLHVKTTDFTYISDMDSIVMGGFKPQFFIADWQDLARGQTVADALVPLNNAGRFDVPVGECRQIWMSLPARDLPPGNYFCDVTVRQTGSHAVRGVMPYKSVRLSLNVAPLRITTSPDFAVFQWDYAADEAYVNDLYEHKVNHFLVTTAIPHPEFDKDGRALTEIDYTAYDRLLRLKLKYARKAGGRLLFAYGMLESFQNLIGKKYGFAYRSAEWDRAFRTTYQSWLDHLFSFGIGYDDFCLQVWDEALEEEIDHTVEGCELMREIDPKVKLVMDGTQKYHEIKRLDPYIDVWIPSLELLQNHKDRVNIRKIYKQVNEPVYCYTCSIHMKGLPIYDYFRLKPWKAADLGMDGVFYWAYNSWRGDPWNDFDGPQSGGTFYADCGAIYNGINGPVTSKRWEAWREGLEDWQIIRLTQQLAGSDKSILSIIENRVTQVAGEIHNIGGATKAHQDFIVQAEKLAAENSLELKQPSTKMDGRNVSIRFKTNRPASAKLYLRWQGESTWEEIPLSKNSTHSFTQICPPNAQPEWMVVAWDENGCVATHKEVVGNRN